MGGLLPRLLLSLVELNLVWLVGVSITVTSLGAGLEGEGERDLTPQDVMQGVGVGEPPLEDPSGEGRSIDGEGEGDGERDRGGDGGSVSAKSVLPGVEGRDAPGLMEVGRARRLREG